MEKLKLWLKNAGITSVVYFVLFLAAIVFGYKFLAGAFLGIFVYVNWNVIKKIWNEEIKPKVQILGEKIEDKIKKH